MPNGRAKELIDLGEFKRASEWLEAKRDLSQIDRVLRAHLELELGDADSAHAQADGLLREHLETRWKAYCLSVSGRALARLGDSQEGIRRLRNGVSLVADRDPYVAAELLGALTISLLTWVGIGPALVELPRLRRLSLVSGNTRALIQFHIVHAQIFAMRGWLRRADTESRIAADLLQNAPNLDQLFKVRQIQANVAIKAGDMDSALRHARECLALAEECGSKVSLGITLGNLAYIAVLTGDYDEARQLMHQVMRLLEPTSHARAAARATALEMALATEDEALAASVLASSDITSADSPRHQTYYDLFFELQRVRWLLYRGRPVDAASSATTALKPIEKLADTNLLDRMKLLAAEAHYLAGAEATAIELFGGVCANVDESNLETFAETYRVAAVLTATSDARLAQAYLARAWRILSVAGLCGIRSATERTATELGIPVSDLGETDELDDPIATIHTIAAALRLGQHPKLLGSEVLTLLDTAGLGHSSVLDGPAPSPVPGVADSARPLALGILGGRTVTIDAPPGHNVASQMLRRAVDQVVRSSGASAAHRVAQEEQIALWPLETWPSQLGMIIAAEKMVELVGTTRRLAPSSITVLITGETGTGKELLARALHDASPRKEKAFIPFNCSTIPRDMLDAQLFGYRRGAFTGAQDAFQGVIRAAAGGTLFLDEIGELSPEAQPKLLRFMESGEIHPLGESRPIHVDVRVVAATNADLEQLVSQSRFRDDLFYRLNIVRLDVPPLRERREEIPPIAQHYLEKCSRESHKIGLRLAEETMEYLILYQWPGNVRQLANEIRRLVALAESGAVLMPEHLSLAISSSRRTIAMAERALAPTELMVRMDQPMSAAAEHVERAMIQYALRLTDQRVEEAAQLLGLSRKGLYLKRRRLGIGDLVTPAQQSDVNAAAAAPATTTVRPS